MSKPKSRKPKELAKVRKMAQMAEDLRQGDHFNITRLTTIKGFCKDEEAAHQFVVYIAKRTHANMMQMEKPRYVDVEQWVSFQALVDEAMLLIDAYMADDTDEHRRALHSMHSRLAKVQNEYRRVGSHTVRIIRSNELVIIERSILCLLSDYGVGAIAYRVARNYAETYNPRYGVGLPPESAPMVQDIVDFWEWYYTELWEE
ncbi:MAG: hypothetical protein AAF639_02725 [Chloroflexota bacterium]